MRFATIIAITAAVRLSTNVEEDKNAKFPAFKDVWAACDTNKDGSVNEAEAKNCLKSSGMPKKAMKMAAKFMIKAAGKDEKLSKKEFGAAYNNFKKWAMKMLKKHGEKKNVELEEEKTKFADVWAACDQNKDGSVNEAEAKNCLTKAAKDGMPMRAVKKAAKLMIKAAGKDQKLTKAEFEGAFKKFNKWAKKMMKKHGKKAEKKNVELDEEAFDVKATTDKYWKECNTDKNGVLTYKEVVTCMQKNNVPARAQKAMGAVLIKNAGIPWEGMVKFAGSVMSHCNKDKDAFLSYDEVKSCLTDFGLTGTQMSQARDELAKYAVLTYQGFGNAVQQMHDATTKTQ